MNEIVLDDAGHLQGEVRAFVSRGEQGAEHLNFLCPACKVLHSPRIRRGAMKGPIWSWNRSVERPSLQPDLSYSVVCEGQTQKCHLTVSAGVAQFAADSTHELAGKNVPLPLLEGVA